MQKKSDVSSKALPTRKGVQPGRGAIPRTGARTAAGRTVARHNRDDRGARLAWIAGGGLALLVVLLVAIGYYNDYIGPARSTAIVVGKHSISLGAYRDRLRAVSILTGDGTQLDAFNKESTVTDMIETEQVILQRAAALGVSVSDDDAALQAAKAVRAPIADNKIADQGTYFFNVRSQLQRSGLSLDRFREIQRAGALKDKIQQKFKADVPKQTLAIKGQELIFTSEDKGRAAQQRIQNGETFGDVAADAIANPSVGRLQPIDWTPVPFNVLPTAVDDVASKLSPGDITDLIKADPPTAAGSPQWILLLLTDRDSNHDVTDAQATQIGAKQQTEWVTQQKNQIGVHSYLSDDKARWAAIHTDLPQQAKPTLTPPVPARPGSSAPGIVPPGGAGPAGPQPSGPPAGPPAPANPAGPPQNPPVPNGTP